jgi:Na+/H+ antiporter NhaA
LFSRIQEIDTMRRAYLATPLLVLMAASTILFPVIGVLELNTAKRRANDGEARAEATDLLFAIGWIAVFMWRVFYSFTHQVTL